MASRACPRRWHYDLPGHGPANLHRSPAPQKPDYIGWKARKHLAVVIRAICTATSAEAALAELEASAQGPWGQKLLTVAAAWHHA